MPSNFKIHSDNEINTTTQIAVNINTSSVVNMYDRDTTTSYATTGYGGSTATTITWTAAAATPISRIYLQNCNFGQFEIYYNGTTTNVFNPAISNNSATASDMYFEFATVTVSSVSLKITNTYPLNAEKRVAEIYIGDEKLEFTRNPNSDNYSPIYYRKGQDMEMSDGGMVSVFLESKFRADITLNYISESNTSQFRSLWNEHFPFVFMPFPSANIYLAGTTTTWNGSAYEVSFLGDLDILKFSSNVRGNGFDVSISLAETPN